MADTFAELSPDLLKAVQGFLTFANNPTQTDAVFDIADGLRHTDLYHHFTAYAHAQPAIAQMLQERYFAPSIHWDTLLSYPTDSLGYLYARAIKQENLDPEFYRSLKVEDDYSYIALRLRQTHDLWHLVTGFGTDLAGEMGLQAFTLAQIHSPLAVTLMAAVTLFTLKTNGPLEAIVDSMQRGWNLGKQAKPFLGQKWEEGWEKPLSQWRQELGIAGA